MKNFLLLLIGVLLFAVSCQDKNLVNENTPNDNHDLLEKCIKNYIHYDATNVAIPVTLKSNGTDVARKIIFHTSSGTMKVISNDCDCGQFSPPLQMVVEGEGTATHLGLLSVVNLTCVDMDGNFLTPVYGFITAANGDEIHTQMGSPYPDLSNPPNIYFPYTIIGGTGRFDGATGNILMYGVADFVAGTWTLSGEGEITY